MESSDRVANSARAPVSARGEQQTAAADAPRCPFVAGVAFDPLDPQQAGRPYRWLAAARRESPVFHMPGYNLWCVTRYEDVLSILKDPQTYSSRKVIRLAQLAPEFEAAFAEGRPDRVLVTLDPPEHTRLRKLAQKAFSPRIVAAQESEIRELANSLIDRFIDQGSCDLVADFAVHLPVQAITSLVGAPREKSVEFKQWADDRLSMLLGTPSLTSEQRRELSARAVAFSNWLRDFVEERRLNPQQDFTTALLQARTEEGDPALTTNEVLTMISTVLSAGSTSTAHFIPLIVRELLRHREQWEEIKGNRKLLPQAIEEGLRFITPVHGVLRTTNREVEIAGVRIPKDADIYVSYAGAQRDESMFEHADEFNIHRPRLHQQIAFGRFVHLCLGAPLARLEVRVALECFLDRMPTLRLLELQEERYQPNLLSPGLQSLKVYW